MTTEATDYPDDRRRDRRVHDAVGLHLQRLCYTSAESSNGQENERANGQADGRLRPFGNDASSTASSRVATRRANKYSIEGYADVRRDHPEVSAYIDALEERIRQLLLDGDPVEVAPTHKVSLSVSGIAFADQRLFEPGEIIGVTLMLYPSESRLASDARVVSANDAPEVANGDRPNYRLEFVRMSDADRLVLTRHVDALAGVRRHDDDDG